MRRLLPQTTGLAGQEKSPTRCKRMGQKQELLSEGYDMKTSEVLNRAADLIEERGHTTGTGWPGTDEFTGRFCLEGAVMAAAGLDGYEGMNALRRCPSYVAVASYLDNPEVNPDGVAPFLWNDRLLHARYQGMADAGWVGGSESAAREYAKERVVEVLRAAALVEAAKENAEIRESVKA